MSDNDGSLQDNEKVSRTIQKWIRERTQLTIGEALCAIYRKYGWLWGDIPRDRGNEVCEYLRKVNLELDDWLKNDYPTMKVRKKHFADEL